MQILKLQRWKYQENVVIGLAKVLRLPRLNWFYGTIKTHTRNSIKLEPNHNKIGLAMEVGSKATGPSRRFSKIMVYHDMKSNAD